MPALADGFGLSAILPRMLRSQLLEVLNQDYVRTDYDKGRRGRAVIFGHVLKNAMITIITILGFSVCALLGGQVILGQMFNIPGMGQAMFGSVQVPDYPVLQAGVFIIAVRLVTVNLLVDISYFAFDPRIRAAI
jgi:ABC-type dipeptide/oligopeptide/nickel transport system permease component